MDINLFLAIVDLINRFHQGQPSDPTRIGSQRNGYDARLATDILAALEPINKKIADITWIKQMERKKQFNSTLNNMSKKRAAAIASGEYKPKARKPLRKTSKKMARRITDYREKGFMTWDERCFICGRTAPRNELDIHHPFLRGNGDNVVIPLCRKGCGCGAHNHHGNDKRLLEINKVIYNKLYMMGQAYIFNDECQRIHGCDYPTFYKQEKTRRTKC